MVECLSGNIPDGVDQQHQSVLRGCLPPDKIILNLDVRADRLSPIVGHLLIVGVLLKATSELRRLALESWQSRN